jgi:TolB protein
MTDIRERQVSALLDEDQDIELRHAIQADPELAAMADTIRQVRSARVFEPASPNFAERGWQRVLQETNADVSTPSAQRVQPAWWRRGWLTAAALLLVAAAVFSSQWWSNETVSASEIRVTGGSVLADLGVKAALYPQYAGSLDEVSYGTGNDKVMVWSRSGKTAASFPLDFAYMRDAAWSPDGTRVAFAGYESGTPGPAVPGIWVVNRDGSHPLEIARPEDVDTAYESPVWSPDGQRIAFTSTHATRSDETGVVYQRTVMTVHADGTNLKTVAKGKNPAWSRDGRELAFAVETAPGESEIWIADADSNQARRLTSGDDPSWSPNSPFIVYVKSRTEHRTLRSDAEGKETFAANVTYQELWVMNVESGTETKLTEGEYPQRQIGLLLAEWERKGVPSANYVVEGVTSDYSPEWSPDGSRILFTRNTNEEHGPHFTLQELQIEYR